MFFVRNFFDFFKCVTWVLKEWFAAHGERFMKTCTIPLEGVCPNTFEVKEHKRCHTRIQEFSKKTLDSFEQILDHKKDQRSQSNVTQFFENHSTCTAKARWAANACNAFIQPKCRRTRVAALKTIRLTMDTIQEVTKALSNTRIIHYVRDPRAIILSRKAAGLLTHTDIKTEAKILCSKMEKNSLTIQHLKGLIRYKFLVIRYEEFAKQPMKIARDILQFSNVQMTRSVKNKLKHLVSSNDTGGAYTTNRKNSSSTATKWKKEITQSEKQLIDSVCQSVYKLYDY